MGEHAIYKITSFEIVSAHVLSIRFDDGVQRTIDFRRILHGELFGPLRDVAVFNAVQLDPETHTLQWPTGADFDPATLHDWPQLEESFVAMAKSWGSHAAA